MTKELRVEFAAFSPPDIRIWNTYFTDRLYELTKIKDMSSRLQNKGVRFNAVAPYGSQPTFFVSDSLQLMCGRLKHRCRIGA